MAEKKVDLKTMTRKEKKDYIWYYYKSHMMMGLFAVVLVGSLIYDVMTKDKIIFSLTLFGEAESGVQIEEIQQDLTQLVAPEATKKEKVLVQFYGLNEVETSFDEMTDLYQQKMISQIAAQELDLVIMGESDFGFYAEEKMFEALNEISGIDWSLVEETQLIKDEQTDLVYGIKMAGSQLLNRINYDTNGKVLALINNSLNKEMAVDVINQLLSE
ncbi:hypothetical protein [Turicibacter sanguinis]|uniref:hypothetical protein n=1 Tax=Turicibacter sanguinis TaxID=154288 RepID=UPI0029428904|nr:hypothetical protein [Turicibacter sanguinis]